MESAPARRPPSRLDHARSELTRRFFAYLGRHPEASQASFTTTIAPIIDQLVRALVLEDRWTDDARTITALLQRHLALVWEAVWSQLSEGNAGNAGNPLDHASQETPGCYDDLAPRAPRASAQVFAVADDAHPLAAPVYFHVAPSPYGVTLTVFATPPGWAPDPTRGMAAVHLEYYDARIQVQCWGEQRGVNGDPSWQYRVAQTDTWSPGHEESIVLVRHVPTWIAPDE